MLPFQARNWAEAQAVADSQAQHLDDLEDILNSPAPALDHPATTENLCVVSQHTRAQDLTTEAPSTSTPAAARQVESTALLSSSAQSHDTSASNMQADVTSNALEEPSHVGQLSVWNTAYQSASSPIAAVWARLPEQLQRLKPQTVSREKGLLLAAHDLVQSNANLAIIGTLQDADSSTGQSTRLPFLLEHMARNKGATAAATIAGAAAGGAIAGPLGIAAGTASVASCTKRTP